DAKQNRKGSTRSPVEQCLNYLRGARKGMFTNEPVQPWWGLVTDMNEFRLYWFDRMPADYLRFVIRQPADLFAGAYDLRSETDDARFDRFLFWKLFQRDFLLSEAGRPPLLRLIERQWVREKKLEGDFYDRYKATRERLFRVLTVSNPQFPGTPTELLRLTQKLLDRFIFAFYCEDMGALMLFPPQLIRDKLKRDSTEYTYDASGTEIWDWFRRLFGFMNTGGRWGRLEVPHINGGLFAHDPLIDGLTIPNDVFAAPSQGANEASLESDRDTLLYLCARYNYASRGDARESLSLYTLGRIFEQSITELEYRVGELENRETVAKLSKRKRDGVYYTPEWVVNYLVEQTLGPWFAEVKAACGWPNEDGVEPGLTEVEAYIARLRTIRIVDPACGSGAFLISAFRRLLEERKEAARQAGRARGGEIAGAIDETPLIGEILANNLYGVDINPASVEITKLALWLHSARADAPLSGLDHTIRCGNSLVSHDFWRGREADDAFRERVNSFDWQTVFPEIWPGGGGGGGFDIVLGNPPYVKLQNLMKVDPEVVAYLQANRGEDTYLSAQTGNFDLYLPFIEKGLRLLGPGGRMAYIAPSLWAVNEYGRGLRALVRERGQLDRWLDFKAHQIFDEAITYTALQFFTYAPNESVRMALAPGGESDAADVDWTDGGLAVPYEDFAPDAEWLITTGEDRALIDRLARDCLRLDDPSLTSGIIVGVQTSADQIYHLTKVSKGKYQCLPKGGTPYVVDIEDEIMRPLISGAEAKRYEKPETSTYILFPYKRNAAGAMRLISSEEMADAHPNAWRYLLTYESVLRAREGGKMNHQEWWGYNYPKNLDKQKSSKLVIPRIVEHLKCSLDTSSVCLDNVDVGGVLSADGVTLAYLMGVLNAPVADFVFRLIAKPFQNDYRAANKQFIAPLPIPDAPPDEREAVAAAARDLQTRWTYRRDLLGAARERLGVLARARHDARWLWPHLKSRADLAEEAPGAFKLAMDRRKWADERFEELEAAECEKLQAALGSGDRLTAEFADGELRLAAGGAPVLSRIYLDEAPGKLAEAYWRWLLLSQAWRDAKRFAGELRRPPYETENAGAAQFMAKVAELATETAAIEQAEEAMNERLYRLYGLTAAE
ncbi:MAG: Eco57I restriction-modification methylase domain-containing protein, partial [Caulobacteraceae bacterium]